MTPGHRYITPLLLALLLSLGMALAACSSTDEPDTDPAPDPTGPETQTRIGLYLTLPVLTDGTAPSSRSLTSRTPADGPDGPAYYNPGEGYENYVDIESKDYRIYVFTPDDRLYAEVSTDSVDIVSWNFTQFSRIYGLSFPVDKDFHNRFQGQDLKLVVLANWHGIFPTDLHPMVSYTPADTTTPATPESSRASGDTDDTTGEDSCTTLAELVSCTGNAAGFMNYQPVASIDRDTRIPLFGVTEFRTVDIFTNRLTWLGNIDLLRAVAKIEVYDAPGTSAKIKSVQLIRHNTALAKAPANVTRQEDYVHGSYNLDYADTPTVPVKSDGGNYESSEPVTLTPITDSESPDNGHFIIYVPEYRNLKTPESATVTPRPDSERTRLKIQYADNDPYYVDFKYYDGAKEGDHFDILRNYWYKFELNKKPDQPKDIDVIVDIQPYANIELNPPFGLDRDEDGNIITDRYEDGTYDILDPDAGKLTKDIDGDIVMKKFKDGSLLCVEKVYKDYIHDDSEIDYEYYFEKDRSGGNMIIIREKSTGGTFHADIPTDDSHEHDESDRALFILDKKGDFQKVSYDSDGNAILSNTDYDGAKIIQANGYQFRSVNEMKKYIGTYVVELADKTQELRYYKDGRVLDWDKGIEGIE